MLAFQSSGDAPGDQGDDEVASVTAGGSGDSAGASVREGSAISKTALSEVGSWKRLFLFPYSCSLPRMRKIRKLTLNQPSFSQ